jgi:hypothetical protein
MASIFPNQETIAGFASNHDSRIQNHSYYAEV